MSWVRLLYAFICQLSLFFARCCIVNIFCVLSRWANRRAGHIIEFCINNALVSDGGFSPFSIFSQSEVHCWICIFKSLDWVRTRLNEREIGRQFLCVSKWQWQSNEKRWFHAIRNYWCECLPLFVLHALAHTHTHTLSYKSAMKIMCVGKIATTHISEPNLTEIMCRVRFFSSLASMPFFPLTFRG